MNRKKVIAWTIYLALLVVIVMHLTSCSEYGDMDIPARNKEAYGLCLLSMNHTDIECVNKYKEQ